MNRISIYGGLGNQMFQYCLNLALNEKGFKSRISISRFLYSYHHNGFLLCTAFKLRLGFPNNILNFFLDKCEFIYKNRIFRAVFRRIIPVYQKKIYNLYKEKDEFVFDINVLRQKNSFIEGIWQVEDYFKDIAGIVRKEFDFKIPKDPVNKDIVKKILNSESVSIHIRRGDYLDPHWQKILGVIKTTDYYNNAVDYLNTKISNPFYFVFSDDVNWAKENLGIQDCIYIEHNKGKKSYVDMYLMSLCKHNIIANSTFSWWAAWLNKNNDKIVIMPEHWIIGKKCTGMFPESWIKINV